MEIKVTLTERCSARCTSCLTPSIKNPQDMTFETWKKIVDITCANSKLIDKFHFYSIGESLLHKEFQKFIDYALDKLHAAHIVSVITTNGSIDLTSYDLSKFMVKIISFNAFSKEIYEKHIGLKWEHVLNNIDKASEQYPIEVHILNYNKETEIAPDLRKILDKENVRGRVSTKVDNQCGELFEEETEREPCNYVINQLNFNPRGDVLLCAHDFYSKNIYGNINTDAWADIMANKTKDIEKHFKLEFTGLCENCNYNKKEDDQSFIKWI